MTNQGGAILYPVPTGLLFRSRPRTLPSRPISSDAIFLRGINDKITVLNTSVNGMSTATGGIYPAISKGGTAVVASGQVYTGLTNAAALDLTLNAATAVLPSGTPLVFSLTTGQGAAATADIYAYGKIYV